MPYVREACDVENPAIAKLGAPRANKLGDSEEEHARSCSCRFLRAGWFWACVIAITTICIAAPIGVATTRRLNAIPEGTPEYKFTGSRGLNTSTSSFYDVSWGLNASKNLTCNMVVHDLPTAPTPTGTPPVPLKIQGGKIVTAEGGTEVALHGVNWFGFNNGKTFVDGLDAEATPSWQGGDFATVVYTLRLLGFNAVRLPFMFGDLSLPPQDYGKPCPGPVPTSDVLAARATNPESPRPNAPAPFEFTKPEGFKAGRCNAYVPNDNTLSRFLWTVQYFIANGFYVVVDYHPHGTAIEDVVTDSITHFVNAWMRVWMSIKCLPNYSTQLQGRIFLDLLNEPDGMEIMWGGGTRQAPLEDYYFAVIEAIDSRSPGQALFLIQGGGQEHLGSNWGDGFVTDPKWIEQRNMSDASSFFKALPSKPYWDQVALGPHMYGPSISLSPDVGAAQWEKYAVSWGHLMRPGYCSSSANSSSSNSSSCHTYPVVAGEIGSSFLNATDIPYMNDMAAFFNKEPGTAAYSTAKMPHWFWWAYNANSGDTGGLINADWQTLNWQKLQWLQDNLGLTPWYKQ